MRNILAGKHTLLVMPTGGGKSLCYQLPSLVNEGLTLVISPLISLMKDQVDKLQKKGIAATAINSSFSRRQVERRLDKLKAGDYDLVYIAPERLESREFQRELGGLEVDLLAVDEAHCISRWGYDFRPSYRHIPRAREKVGSPVVLATTATATPKIQKDIQDQLKLPAMDTYVHGFNRPNLFFRVEAGGNGYDKWSRLKFLLDKYSSGSIIVYVGTRSEAEIISDEINKKTELLALPYHGGIEREERKQIQQNFLEDEVPVIVATNAFGMGIDKPDIRQVIHYRLPGNLESYYQEAGRAGRDEKPATCTLLYNPEDTKLQHFFIQNAAPDRQELCRLYDRIRSSPPGDKHNLLPPGRTAHVNKYVLAANTGVNEVKVQVGISLLEEAEWIAALGAKGEKIYLKIKPENLDKLNRTLHRLQERKKEKYRRLHRMVDYAEASEGCRRLYILRYFGDMSEPKSKQCCDLCNPDRRPAPRSSPTEKLIIRSVSQLPFPAGIRKLSLILSGSRNKKILERGFEKLEVYGKLRDLQTGAVEDIIKRMIEDNLLELTKQKTLEPARPTPPEPQLEPPARKKDRDGEDPYPIF